MMTTPSPEKPKAWWAITKADVLIWVVMLIVALGVWAWTGDPRNAVSVGIGFVGFLALDLLKRYLFRDPAWAIANRQDPRTKSTGPLLPIELRVGDMLTTESGEWEVAMRPSFSGDGKVVCGRIQRPGEPASVKDVTWSAIERITVRRAG